MQVAPGMRELTTKSSLWAASSQGDPSLYPGGRNPVLGGHVPSWGLTCHEAVQWECRESGRPVYDTRAVPGTHHVLHRGELNYRLHLHLRNGLSIQQQPLSCPRLVEGIYIQAMSQPCSPGLHIGPESDHLLQPPPTLPSGPGSASARLDYCQSPQQVPRGHPPESALAKRTFCDEKYSASALATECLKCEYCDPGSKSSVIS